MAAPGRAQAAQHRMRDAVEDAMRRAAMDALGEAVRRTPIDTGALRESGHIDPPNPDRSLGDRSQIHIVFSTPYAAVQHERLDYQHPRGGQAKYLESVIQERAPRYAAVLAAAAKRALAEGG